jgi:hypothetical protein
MFLIEMVKISKSFEVRYWMDHLFQNKHLTNQQTMGIISQFDHMKLLNLNINLFLRMIKLSFLSYRLLFRVKYFASKIWVNSRDAPVSVQDWGLGTQLTGTGTCLLLNDLMNHNETCSVNTWNRGLHNETLADLPNASFQNL